MTGDRRSDEELIEAANGGDPAALEALYYRYRDWVASLALRFTGNREDALDVLQDTFAYLFGKFPGFTLTAKMKTFLYPVVKNLSIARRRKGRRYVPLEGIDESVAVEDAPGPAASRRELASLLEVLPEGEREVVLLRFVDGLKLAEIAAALSIPVGTAKSRLHNALEKLRTHPAVKKYFAR